MYIGGGRIWTRRFPEMETETETGGMVEMMRARKVR